jgi:hypothetical protein
MRPLARLSIAKMVKVGIKHERLCAQSNRAEEKNNEEKEPRIQKGHGVEL